jgi:hypothetical protein
MLYGKFQPGMAQIRSKPDSATFIRMSGLDLIGRGEDTKETVASKSGNTSPHKRVYRE